MKQIAAGRADAKADESPKWSMYKDFLGKNRKYVEAQLHNIIADKFKERIVCTFRGNRLITFHFIKNEVDEICFMFSEEVSPEQVIETIGYEFSKCCKITETDYRIKTPTGTYVINIYNTPAGTWASLSNLTKSLRGGTNIL